MVLQKPLGTTRLENAEIFGKVRKPPFPDLFPVNRCVNDVTRVCRGRIEAALSPTFTTHISKTRRRIDLDWWHSFSHKQLYQSVRTVKKMCRNLAIGCHDFFPPNSRSNVEFSRAFCRIFVDFRKVSSNKEQRPLLLASIFGKVGV